MIIKIDEDISLELISENHSKQIFDLVDANRPYLREFLCFADRMKIVESALN